MSLLFITREQYFCNIMAKTIYIKWKHGDVRFVLDSCWIFVVLAYWSNSPPIDVAPPIDMSLLLDTFFWLRANTKIWEVIVRFVDIGGIDG